jgi:DNA adenine methylase
MNLIVKKVNINSMKPPIKWAGGKTQILDKISFPESVENYYEPFLGGGSVLLHFLEYVKADKVKVSGKIFAFDINEYVIGMYNNIKIHPTEYISSVKRIIKAYQGADGVEEEKEYYYEARKRFNGLKDKSSLDSTALFLFLNKTCFRGLYREGPNGFNVPFGNYKSPEILNDEYILSLSSLIKNVVFRVSSWDETLSKSFGTNDFVYLDPPYVPVTSTSFVGYTSNSFVHHTQFFGLVLNIEGRFTMSNSDTSLVRDAFDEGFGISYIDCKRSINSKNPGSKIGEVLITNW